MQFSTEAVRELAQLLNETGLYEISVATQAEGAAPMRIVVRSTPPAPTRPQIIAAPPQAPAAPTIVPPPDVTVVIGTDVLTPDEHDAGEGTETVVPTVPVTATAVGLFSLAPELKVGDSVKKGQVLAFVESLKIPNEVCAPQPGRLAQVLVEDGLGVEYGQTLLLLEVDA